MMIKRSALLTALALFVVTAGGAPLAADSLSRMLAKSPFQPSDLDAMRAAERMLHSRAGSSMGDSVTWSNPDTEAHGKVRLAGHLNGCVLLRHSAVPAGEVIGRQVDRKFCSTTNGAWLPSQKVDASRFPVERGRPKF